MNITRGNGYYVFAAGCSQVINSAIAHRFGKRPVFLYTALLMLVAVIVGLTGEFAKQIFADVYKVPSYQGYLANRVLTGFGQGPIEFLVTSSVPDLFFVHQRATMLAIWHLGASCKP